MYILLIVKQPCVRVSGTESITAVYSVSLAVERSGHYTVHVTVLVVSYLCAVSSIVESTLCALGISLHAI